MTIKSYDIHISFKYLRYAEGKNYLELDIEPCTNEMIIYTPNEERWDSLFGEWAKGRKNIIIQRIKSKMYDQGFFKFEEY